MQEITFHLGSAGHPVSWTLHAVYGRACGIVFASARAWYARQVSAPKLATTPPGGQYVVQIRNNQVVNAELFFDAEYFRHHQEPDDLSWLCQFHTFPLEMPERLKDIVTADLRSRLIAAGFLIPRAEWIARYPDQAEFLRQFRELRHRDGA